MDSLLLPYHSNATGHETTQESMALPQDKEGTAIILECVPSCGATMCG